MNLSRQTKESIKTALAITLSYAIALSMNWGNPHWSAFAVALISLSTIGQSINKGAMRMLGTLVAAVVALFFIALFPQERWQFFLLLSVYIGFCTYMMLGKHIQYFWNMCGLVCVIICIAAATTAGDPFYIAILRAEETGLGVLVYSLVSFLIWPNDSETSFKSATTRLDQAKLDLYRCYLNIVSGKGEASSEQAPQQQIVQTKAQFDQLLSAAETDSYAIRELRQQWRQYQHLSDRFIHAMEHWHESLHDVRSLQLEKLVPNLKIFERVVELRLKQIMAMQSGQETTQHTEPVKLTTAEDEINKLTHFDRAALSFCLEQLRQIEQISFSMMQTMREIIDPSSTCDTVALQTGNQVKGFIDKDRLVSALRVMASMWLAYLAYIYINGIPAGTTFVTISSVFTMIMAGVPQAPVAIFFIPVAGSVLFATLVYVFLLPQMSNFMELGLLLFVVTFMICQLFAKPQQALDRTFGLVMFVTILGISNTQTHSILGPLNTALMFVLVFLLLSITHHFPYPPYPEHAFLRLLKRYFSNGRSLLKALIRKVDEPEPDFSQWRFDWRIKELAMIPDKLAFWAKFIKANALQGIANDDLQAIVTSLKKLAFHLEELFTIRRQPELKPLLKALQHDAEEWKNYLIEIFNSLEKDLNTSDYNSCRERLDRIIQNIEEAINGVMSEQGNTSLIAEDYHSFYRLLGAYRSVSEALLEYVALAEKIDSNEWREVRFA